MRTEVTLLVCAALAILAIQISKLPPPALRRADNRRSPPPNEPDRPQVGARGSREARVAWTGFGCAAVAAVGHLVFPTANPLWLALLAVAILSVPAAAALSFAGSSRKDDET